MVLLIVILAVLYYFWPSPPAEVVAPADPNVVAEIGDYVITKGELERRVMTELRPYDEDYYDEQAEPIDAETALMKMIAEKAMAMEARKQGYLEDETIHVSIKRFEDRGLVNMLLQKQLPEKITVTEEEVKKKMQADPKLDMVRAKALLERAEANRILDQYYNELYKKSNVKKLTENFSRVIQIHQRLLYQPKKPRNVGFIRNYQVKEDLTQEEKDIVLAQYDSGKITLEDWFNSLCDIVPPRRPQNLNTPDGVEQLLDSTLKMPLMVSESKSIGLDKDKDFLAQVREYEDMRLLSEAKLRKHKEVKEPTEEQITAYYNENKETFGKSKNLKIDLIWCQDLETAGKAKADLGTGKDFESVKQQYSLEKEVKPFNTYPTNEGLFWKDLWAGEPNEIVGPVKGFYRDGINWRIVKILEKKPGELREYSSNIQRQVKDKMMNDQRNALIDEYGKELLKKYSYKIYADRIKDIDPLDIP